MWGREVWKVIKSSLISELLKAIKRLYSFRIKKLLEESGNPLLEELTIRLGQ